MGEDCFPWEEGCTGFLRIVEGVWIVFFRIEVGAPLFGDRTDNGSGLSMLDVRFRFASWA